MKNFIRKGKSVIRKLQFAVRDRFINRAYRKKLKNSNFSIISSDCIGGLICKDLRQRFNSPTINFFFEAEDYIKFAARLKEYVENGILKDITSDGEYVKVAIMIDDEQVLAHCIHYKTAKDFIDKWECRKKRINYNNCFFMMNDRNGFTEEHLRKFDALPYANKVCFVHKKHEDSSSAFYIKGSENDNYVKPMTDYKHGLGIKRRYDDFKFVDWLNSVINIEKDKKE